MQTSAMTAPRGMRAVLGSRRLERLLRLRHQYPGQRARADRAAAFRAENARCAGVRPHPAGHRADAVPQHGVLRLARLSAGQEDRPHRVCALPSGISVPHMFVVTFVVMLPILNADQGSRAGLGGRPHLGVRAELRADGRRLHRAGRSARSRRAPRCSARSPASRSPSSRCGRACRCSRRR